MKCTSPGEIISEDSRVNKGHELETVLSGGADVSPVGFYWEGLLPGDFSPALLK